MNIKICHIADTHIRNLKYHIEYRQIFDELYEILKKEKPDYIIHCGDIAHTKTQISPEFVELCSDFFRNLANIAPTYIILGNHDGNLRNFSRQDAISPIVEALSMPTLIMAKNSSKIALAGPYVLNVLSVFDRDNWDLDPDPTKVNIALFHGAVKGVVTDTGYVLDHGDIELDVLKKFDYAFLGDIHKTNQMLDFRGRIRYPGSTIQQNHGEPDDKGFLMWDLEGKEKFYVKHIKLKNPKPFKTIVLTPEGTLPTSVSAPKGCRLRLISNTNLPIDVIKKVTNVAKTRFEPETFSFVNRASKKFSDAGIASLYFKDLRDALTQENLIKEYLKDFKASDELTKKVLELNKKYNTVVEEDESHLRNINWKLNSMRWENLFNYGEDNSIDFDKLRGVVGIFGKNFSGKSSVVDALLWGIYNSTSKMAKKNISFINQNKESAQISLSIEIMGKTYTIERKIKKYNKIKKGRTVEEAKIELEFSRYDPATKQVENLNDLNRIATDKSIRKYLGSLDDFLITSMSSQHGALQFVNEGSTKRKEILAKFLDLEIFDQKFQLAKKDSADLKGALKKIENINYRDEAYVIEKDIILNDADIEQKKKNKESARTALNFLKEGKQKIEAKINSLPVKIIDIGRKIMTLAKNQASLEKFKTKEESLSEKYRIKEQLLLEIEGFLADFDIKELKEKQNLSLTKQRELNLLVNSIRQEEIKEEMEEKKISLLDEVPCGSEFSHCKFIKDAYLAKENIKIYKTTLSVLQEQREVLDSAVSSLKSDHIEKSIEKYSLLEKKYATTKEKLSSLALEKVKNSQQITNLARTIKEQEQQIKEYNKNKKNISKLEKLSETEKKYLSDINEAESLLNACEAEYLNLHMIRGTLKQKLEETIRQKDEKQEMDQEYSAYNLFMACFHPNGISYSIIKQKLPIINSEIQKILSNIVNFEVFFESEEKKLNILIKHPKYSPRPLESGSGAEKSIAAMAIRLALLSVSSLPKSDIFILDEPGTSLDANNLEGFTRIVDLIKTNFKTVLLISHMDFLKDIVDSTIDIDKVDGFARVNQ